MSWHTVAIRSVESVGPDTVAVTLETPAGLSAVPGQFLKLRRTMNGDPVTRFYSLSATSDGLEVTVAVDPAGSLSPWLVEASPGATVEIDGPYGQAFYEDAPTVVLLAGDVGVAPAVGVAERARAAGAQVTLVYADDVRLHERRLARLAAGGVSVRVLQAEADLAPALADRLPTDGRVFVYGFAPFVERATAAIDAAGGDAETATIENFG